MDYRFLDDDDKARIIADVQASCPSSDALLREREAAHFRAVVGAKLGLNPEPDDIDYDQASGDLAKAAVRAKAVESIYVDLGVTMPLVSDV